MYCKCHVCHTVHMYDLVGCTLNLLLLFSCVCACLYGTMSVLNTICVMYVFVYVCIC